MINWLRMPFLVLCFAFVAACSDTPVSESKDLVYDKNASNVAVLFGVPDNLPGVRVDMRELETLFKQPEYGLKVYAYLDKSPSEIAQLTGQHAKEVDANGTLLFYFSGHGSEDGMLMAYGGALDFRNVASAIKQNRTTPLKRLLTVVDSCFSGNLVDGNVAISNSGGPQVANGNGTVPGNTGDDFGNPWGIFGLSSFESPGEFRSYEQNYSEPLNDLANEKIFEALAPYAGHGGYGLQATTLYEQVLVLSSSRKTETSADTNSGGAFTSGFRAALGQMRNQPGAKIQDLINATISNVTSYGHTPVYRAEPQDVVLNDLVFGATTPSTTTPPATTTNTKVESATGIPPAGSMYLALEEDQFGMAAFFVSAPADVTEVALCLGDKATCQTSAKKDVIFKVIPGTDTTRRNYVSGDRRLLQAGNYTILGFAAGQVARTQTVTLQAK